MIRMLMSIFYLLTSLLTYLFISILTYLQMQHSASISAEEQSIKMAQYSAITSGGEESSTEKLWALYCSRPRERLALCPTLARGGGAFSRSGMPHSRICLCIHWNLDRALIITAIVTLTCCIQFGRSRYVCSNISLVKLAEIQLGALKFEIWLSSANSSINSWVGDSKGSSITQPVADPTILKRGMEENLSFPVLIYRKCTQRSIGLLHGKRRLFGKKYWANGGAAAP